MGQLADDEYALLRHSVKCAIFLQVKDEESFENAASIQAFRSGLDIFVSDKVPSLREVSSLRALPFMQII